MISARAYFFPQIIVVLYSMIHIIFLQQLLQTNAVTTKLLVATTNTSATSHYVHFFCENKFGVVTQRSSSSSDYNKFDNKT